MKAFILSFLGWPRIAVLTLPSEKLIVVLSVMVVVYFFTILISCVFSVALICVKKRKFQNKVSNLSNSQDLSKSMNKVGSEEVEVRFNNLSDVSDQANRIKRFGRKDPKDFPKSESTSGNILEDPIPIQETSNITTGVIIPTNAECQNNELTIVVDNLEAIQILDQEVVHLEDSNEQIELSDLTFQKNENLKYFMNETNSDFEIQVLFVNEEKCLAQIQSAKRSLITNLLLCGLLIVGHVIIALLPTVERIFYSIILFTSVKGALPILSTAANFGTVRYVISQYKLYFCNRCSG